ncbi:hypothetical protein PVAND_000152 [Polypedilum vanderplanki]|uniref:Peptidase S1 domain-containing protein n=1 Tax=Polypedilum vanderplanki TaxID=319348 RepID=A0A9J6BJ67_POLVA|nr:hypothetical protein PVAND_000152 [Polypedilum vanderplanki]
MIVPLKLQDLLDKMNEAMICAHEKEQILAVSEMIVWQKLGGPLFFESDVNRYEAIGVVSFGDGCARDFPGIYGKLSDMQTHFGSNNTL